MSLVRYVVIFGSMTICSTALVRAQVEKAFATDAEIDLLLTQTERAVGHYKPLIDQEELQLARTMGLRQLMIAKW